MQKKYNFSLESYPNVSYCYDRIFDAYHVMPMAHSHPGFEIMYVVFGGASIEVYSDSDSSVIIEKTNLYPGDFIFIDGTRSHRLFIGEKSTRILNVEARPSHDPMYYAQPTIKAVILQDKNLKEFWDSSLISIRMFDSRNIFDLMDMLIKKYTLNANIDALKQHTRPQTSYSGKLPVLIDSVANLAIITKLTEIILAETAAIYCQNLKVYRGHSIIRKAVFMIENCIGRITSQEIAKELNISPSYLYRLFSECFGQSVNQYISDYKIQRACNRFKSFHDIKVGDIVQELGYSNMQKFQRHFYKVMGMLPTEYRKMIRESKDHWITTHQDYYPK